MLDKHLKKDLKESFAAPEPLGKKQFLGNLNYPKASPLEVLRVQAEYIPKFVWVLSVTPIFLILLLQCLAAASVGGKDLIWYLSAFMPILAVLAVTGTFRSGAYGMAELELASKYNLPQILLMRMGILGLLDLSIVLAAVFLIVSMGEMTVLHTALYLLVPWESTCLLTFQVEKHRKGRETIWCNILCGFFVSMSEIILKNREFASCLENVYLWLAAFCVLSFLLARQVYRICLDKEAWSWNMYMAG